jgi:cyclopropane fatty-acyl-phospholipid synthase-like methyltransferase
MTRPRAVDLAALGSAPRSPRSFRGRSIAALWRRSWASTAPSFDQRVELSHATRRGKFQVWDEILDKLHLAATNVLDMGCGRSAVLTAVASRLTT